MMTVLLTMAFIVSDGIENADVFFITDSPGYAWCKLRGWRGWYWRWWWCWCWSGEYRRRVKDLQGAGRQQDRDHRWILLPDGDKMVTMIQQEESPTSELSSSRSWPQVSLKKTTRLLPLLQVAPRCLSMILVMNMRNMQCNDTLDK